MDQEVIRLAGEIKDLTASHKQDEDDFWKELESDEDEKQTMPEFIDILIFGLAGGDIMKGKAILTGVTLIEALEWWRLKCEFSGTKEDD